MSERTKIRVASSVHVGYAPQYAASGLGLFEKAGLDVEFRPQVPAGSASIVETLKHRAADLVLSSVLAAIRLKTEGYDPVLVCQVNQKISHGLLARTADADGAFTWDKLRGSSVIVHPSHIPTPWVAFRELLWQKSISLDDIALMVGFTAKEALEEFRRGTGSFLVCDLDTVDTTGLSEVARITEGIGPIPWSVYCTTREAALRQAGPISRFRQSIAAAVDWLYRVPAAEAADMVAPFLPDLSMDQIVAKMRRSVAARQWTEGGGVSLGQIKCWQGALRRGGFLNSKMSLEEFVLDGV